MIVSAVVFEGAGSLHKLRANSPVVLPLGAGGLLAPLFPLPVESLTGWGVRFRADLAFQLALSVFAITCIKISADCFFVL